MKKSSGPPLSEKSLERARAAIERWRARLIDFSKRNPLLYFECTRATRLRISRPDADDLFQKLLVQGKSLEFSFPSLPARVFEESPLWQDDPREPAPKTVKLDERKGDLLVDYSGSSARDVVELQRALRRLAKRQREVEEERGINTLHLAFGILIWREAPQEQGTHRAPLLLVRASLAQQGRSDPFQLVAAEELVVLNPVIVAFLQQQWGVRLSHPEVTDLWKPSGHLRKLEQEVKALGFRILDEVWLSHFSFEKLAMWEELGQQDVPKSVLRHPVLGPAVTGSPVEQNSDLAPNFWEQFEKPATYPVIEADHSQLEVLALLESGASLVVEGPPGTGKSQTIANAIASALRNEKTVLFVSQKRAALDVVLARLREIGLDHLCLDLHGHELDRGRVVEELARRLDRALEEKAKEEDPAPIFEQRIRHRKALDAYVQELHRPRGRNHYTAYRVLGELSIMAAAPDLVVPGWRLSPLKLSREEEALLREHLRQIEETGLWDQAPTHPWRDAVLTRPFAAFRSELQKGLTELTELLEDTLSLSTILQEAFGEEFRLRSFANVPIVAEALALLREPPEHLEALWLTLPSNAALEAAEKARRGAALETEAAQLREQLTFRGVEALIGIGSDARLLFERYRLEYATYLRWLRKNFWRDQRVLANLTGRWLSYDIASSALETCVSLQDVCDEIASLRCQLASLIGDGGLNLWGWRRLAEGLEWAAKLSEVFGHSLSEATAASIRRLHCEGQLKSTAQQVGEYLARVSAAWTRLGAIFKDLFPAGLEGVALDQIPFDQLLARCQSWLTNQATLPEWAEFHQAQEMAVKAGLGPFLEAARKAKIKSPDLEKTFVKFLRRRWVEEVWKEVPVLARFSSRKHELARREFAELDRQLCGLAARVVARKAWERQGSIRLAAAYGLPFYELLEEIRLLKHEAKKKKRHLPVRQLFPRLPNLLRLLAPCVMASPLAVSSYLPRAVFACDLILVDEASQLRPEDAVGSLLRGSQVAVFGDTKQMPPSQFFERMMEEDDSFDDLNSDDLPPEDVTAFESVLDYLATILPRRRLRWHYRSRDERLIAFSNNHFYADAPLVTFPAPFRSTSAANTGVRLVVVDDGLWEPGTRRNAREAQEVVRVVETMLREQSDRSVGVIALGLGQAETIEALLEGRFQGDPDLEAAARRSLLFVKNLENVQGDERDEIVLSIGYAPTVPGGPVPLRFGPLNLEGGERRLNVAITRARHRTTVICSFFPDALLRAENMRPGVRKLFEYLQYCQRGGDFVTVDLESRLGSCESPLEEAIMDALISHGYEVRAQVGASQYRIDLAIVDPDNPQRFILGIECDGATYHSAPSARERDRLRQEVLERLGWHITRVWSTDWLNNPDAELKRLIKKIESLRKKAQTT